MILSLHTVAREVTRVDIDNTVVTRVNVYTTMPIVVIKFTTLVYIPLAVVCSFVWITNNRVDDWFIIQQD